MKFVILISKNVSTFEWVRLPGPLPPRGVGLFNFQSFLFVLYIPHYSIKIHSFSEFIKGQLSELRKLSPEQKRASSAKNKAAKEKKTPLSPASTSSNEKKFPLIRTGSMKETKRPNMEKQFVFKPQFFRVCTLSCALLRSTMSIFNH